MIEIESWAGELARKLKDAFGGRVLFVGYQGSYGRGEATEGSDIDIVCVLEDVGVRDLGVYRRLVGEMPWGELACGFLCGVKELLAWPRWDLYGLVLDTKPVWGDLGALVPAFNKEDAREALRNGVANLYHGAVHTYLYGGAGEALPGLGKAAFFCLRFWALVRYGVYYPSRRELGDVLDGREKAVLELGQEDGAAMEEAYSLLIGWCGDVLAGLGE